MTVNLETFLTVDPAQLASPMQALQERLRGDLGLGRMLRLTSDEEERIAVALAFHDIAEDRRRMLAEILAQAAE